MLRKVTRQEIVKDKPRIGAQIAALQRAFYDEETLEWYRTHETEQAYYDMYDMLSYPEPQPTTFSQILSPNLTQLEGFTDILTQKLDGLLSTLDVEELILMPYLRLDLFGNRNNDHPLLVAAYKKLETLLHTNTWLEAVCIPRKDMGEIIAALFWMIRCDPSLPEYIFLFDANEKLEFFLCRYGNIHLTELGEQKLHPQLLPSLGWQLIEGPETDPFSEDGVIEGRELI